jgi:hypothetical protein
MIKTYMSHPIRGPLKDMATPADLKRNCDAAMELAEKIRLYMSVNYRDAGFELYVPAEHEAFVNRAWRNGVMSVSEILAIDCQIIDEEYNDLVLIYAPFGPPVEGCHTEKNHATMRGIHVIVFKDLAEFKDKMEAYLEAKGIYE